MTPRPGRLQVRVPTPHPSANMSLSIDVVDLNVPMLLGLRELRREGLIVDYLDSELRNKRLHWSVPLLDKRGHLYLEKDSPVSYFLRAEIERRHKLFFHRSAEKVFNLVKRSKLSPQQTELRKLTDSVTAACSTCKQFSSHPFRFRATITNEDIAFNQELAMDLDFLHDRPVLHVIDTQTNFQNSVWVDDKSAEGLWNSFVTCWSTL